MLIFVTLLTSLPVTMKKILLSISFIFAVYAGLPAQDDGGVQARKDSLRRVIPTLEGEEKILAYRQLGLIYYGEAKDEQTMDSLLDRKSVV